MSELPFRIAGRIVPQDSFKSYPTQTHDDFGFQNFDLPLQIVLALIQLLGTWLIIRRRATTGRCDIHILKEETIASRLSRRLIRKPSPVQGREQESARRVPRELTSRPV